MKELGYQHIEFYELSVNPEEAQAPYFLEKVYMIINNRYGAVIYINNRANFMFRIPLETWTWSAIWCIIYPQNLVFLADLNVNMI